MLRPVIRTRQIVSKQTKRYCFSSFNPIFLELKQTEAKRSEAHSILFIREIVQCSLHLPEIPGENCTIPGCSISRKDKGISIFKVPLPNNEFSKKWSQGLINIILKYRQGDKSLNERIESHKLFVCEKHFTADQIYVYPSRKSLKEGVLPTLNLPRPSANATNNLSTSAFEKIEEYSFLQAQLPQPQPSSVYKSFDEFKLRI